jgi:WD40-like Beta Propeller Repeat
MTNSMRKRTFAPWLLAVAAPLVWIPRLAITPGPSPTGSVRSELIRLQNEKGLTVAWVDSNSLGRAYFTHSGVADVEAIAFKKRMVVQLQNSLEAFRPGGFNNEEYPGVFGIGGCWSHDQRKLATTVADHSTAGVRLEIIDVDSNKIRTIAINGDQRRRVMSQCWSPDDQKLVYETDANVMVFNVADDRSEAVAKGEDPTWSPDGEWIAFRDRDTYYAIHPDSSGKKKLFHNYWGDAVSALYWSPDSRIVAYVRELGFLQGGAFDAEVNQLRVRRLEDGSEAWLCRDSVQLEGYLWITKRELKKRTKSGPPRLLSTRKFPIIHEGYSLL